MPPDPQNIAIWGFGREGRAGYAYLQQRYPGARFFVIDRAAQDFEGPGVFLDWEHGCADITKGRFDLLLKSPGISLYHEEIAAAKSKGTILTSCTNLWFEQYPAARTLVVTGTKGKSTTASLIAYLLRQKGYDIALAGNIGTPLLTIAPGRDLTMIELSSYQIADLRYAPDVAVILNLFPEHADWHGGVQHYYRDKLRLIDLEPRQIVVHQDDPALKAAVSGRDNVAFFSGEDVPFDRPGSLRGAHNILNINAALSAIQAAGLVADFAPDALAGFQALPHRLEELGTKDGVLYVNDSISTIPEAAVAALDVYQDRPVFLILGGQDRGQDYTGLADAIRVHGRVQVLTLPGNGPRIAECLSACDIPVRQCTALEEAVQAAQNAAWDTAQKDSVILLSPAAPSYGTFRDFEERGDVFRVSGGF